MTLKAMRLFQDIMEVYEPQRKTEVKYEKPKSAAKIALEEKREKLLEIVKRVVKVFESTESIKDQKT